MKEICIDLKGAPLAGTKLVKVYMTGVSSAARMIVLLYFKKEYYVPIVIRLKKDKLIGSNLSKNNQNLQILLAKNLELIMEDLKKVDPKVYDAIRLELQRQQKKDCSKH